MACLVKEVFPEKLAPKEEEETLDSQDPKDRKASKENEDLKELEDRKVPPASQEVLAMLVLLDLPERLVLQA